MSGSDESRKVREWKARLFRHLRHGDIFSVFSSVRPYNKRIFIVVRHINPHTLEVIELTPENTVNLIDSGLAEKTHLTYQEFSAGSFHVCEAPYRT